MKKTSNHSNDKRENLTVNVATLSEILDCGRATAVKIGDDAGAKIQIGRRVLYNVSVIERYLNAMAGN